MSGVRWIGKKTGRRCDGEGEGEGEGFRVVGQHFDARRHDEDTGACRAFEDGRSSFSNLVAHENSGGCEGGWRSRYARDVGGKAGHVAMAGACQEDDKIEAADRAVD